MEHGELGIAALDHEPVRRIVRQRSADLAAKFLKGCHKSRLSQAGYQYFSSWAGRTSEDCSQLIGTAVYSADVVRIVCRESANATSTESVLSRCSTGIWRNIV